MRTKSLLTVPLFAALLAATASAQDTDVWTKRGDVTFPNGDHFVGSMNGQGVLEFGGGSRYEGGFSQGAFDGRGVLQYASGDRYEGEFSHGTPTGRGVYQFADGARFEGRFTQGKPDGDGVLTTPDGSRFEGAWSAGAPRGVTRTAGATQLDSVKRCYFTRCD